MKYDEHVEEDHKEAGRRSRIIGLTRSLTFAVREKKVKIAKKKDISRECEEWAPWIMKE